MNHKFFTAFILFMSLLLPISKVSALKMGEFSAICQSFAGECNDLPVINAYVGGALDLLAALDERTDYLQKIYCKDPKELFNISDIVQFMEQRSDQYASDNAMLVLVKYFETHGGCKP